MCVRLNKAPSLAEKRPRNLFGIRAWILIIFYNSVIMGGAINKVVSKYNFRLFSLLSSMTFRNFRSK